MRWLFALGLAAACALGCTSPGDPILPDAGDRRFQAACDQPPAGPTAGDDTFGSIYEELLATTSVSRCQDAACHGGSSGQAGFSMGTDRAGAYQGLIDYGLIVPGPPVDGGVPADAAGPVEAPTSVRALYFVVAPTPSGGRPRMPRDLCSAQGVPNRLLNDAELARIVSWGLRGAPDD